MDGAGFAKLMRDTSLQGGRLTGSEVDLAFAKVKTVSERRISYMQFLEALGVVGTKTGMHMEALVARVERAQAGPQLHGTVAESNRFHDDKSLYTGVHANGGPSTVDSDKVASLSQHLDRSPADTRGVKTVASTVRSASTRHLARSDTASASGKPLPVPASDVIAAPPSATGEPLPPVRPPSSESAKSKSATVPVAVEETKMEGGRAESMAEVFQRFCAGQLDMDGRQFAKLTRDCDLVSSGLTSTDVDLIFAKVKADAKARRITFQQFLAALDLCASKRGERAEDLKQRLMAQGGPKFTGTRAEYSKFHDDKSTYSGMYADIHAANRAGTNSSTGSSRNLLGRTKSGRDVSKSSPVSSQELWTHH